MKNIKNNYKIDQLYNYEKINEKMGNYNTTDKMIEHFYKICCQRRLIEEKLIKIGYESNMDLQTIYIDDFKRTKALGYIINVKKSFDDKTSNPKIRYNNKKIFKKLLFKYQTDPWIIKSPHITKKRGKKIHTHTLNKIIEIINI